MPVFRVYTGSPAPCPYLPDRVSINEYWVTRRLTPESYQLLMEQGFRKFGAVSFRPRCVGCTECRSIRYPIEQFRPDRSQRRNWKANQDLRVEFNRPTLDDARMELYHRYHEAQGVLRGWPENDIGPHEYESTFVRNPIPGVEISLWLEDLLVGVVLTELTPDVISGIYHYHDPDLRKRGLGTYGMLHTIEHGRMLGKRYAYFGYYVQGCVSVEYKARFQPAEILDDNREWAPFRPGEASGSA